MARSQTMPAPEHILPGRPVPIPTAATHFVNGNPLKPPFPAGLEEAVFGLGCFWGAERKFWQTPGVWSTSAGYAGGATPNPTYEEVCSGRTGHTEVVRVIFDPKLVTAVRSAAERLGYSHMNLISGAGHDACWAAKVAPTTMVMCPCVGGLSHNEAEDISKDWASAGADVENADFPALEEEARAEFLRVRQRQRRTRRNRGPRDHAIEIGVVRGDGAGLEQAADQKTRAEFFGGKRVRRFRRREVMELHEKGF